MATIHPVQSGLRLSKSLAPIQASVDAPLHPQMTAPPSKVLQNRLSQKTVSRQVLGSLAEHVEARSKALNCPLHALLPQIRATFGLVPLP